MQVDVQDGWKVEGGHGGSEESEWKHVRTMMKTKMGGRCELEGTMVCSRKSEGGKEGRREGRKMSTHSNISILPRVQSEYVPGSGESFFSKRCAGLYASE